MVLVPGHAPNVQPTKTPRRVTLRYCCEPLDSCTNLDSATSKMSPASRAAIIPGPSAMGSASIDGSDRSLQSSNGQADHALRVKVGYRGAGLRDQLSE